jgi:5'-deoxynucleotidase YfbR-like HD superfamily hydrolase
LANIHDVSEAYVGDTPTDTLAGHSPDAKKQLEDAGVAQMLADFAHMPDFCDAVREYEAQQTPESRFVRAVDKLMVLLIHFPNKGTVLQRHYSRDSHLRGEAALLERDAFKYGEFTEIMDLRRELGQMIADQYLSDTKAA